MKDTKTKVEGGGEIKMSLYEINQSLFAQKPSLSAEDITAGINKINEFKQSRPEAKVFMLLGREYNYYTVFIDNGSKATLGDEVVACAQSVGNIKDIDIDTNGVIAIWITLPNTKENMTMCFYLFDYDGGTIYIGG